jgi:hypothetical protein
MLPERTDLVRESTQDGVWNTPENVTPIGLTGPLTNPVSQPSIHTLQRQLSDIFVGRQHAPGIARAFARDCKKRCTRYRESAAPSSRHRLRLTCSVPIPRPPSLPSLRLEGPAPRALLDDAGTVIPCPPVNRAHMPSQDRSTARPARPETDPATTSGTGWQRRRGVPASGRA